MRWAPPLLQSCRVSLTLQQATADDSDVLVQEVQVKLGTFSGSQAAAELSGVLWLGRWTAMTC